MSDEIERGERIRGYRDELLQSLQRAYEQRRSAPDHSLQLLRQAAEGLCYCTLLTKNRFGLDQRAELLELIRLATPFIKQDEEALRAMREWGNQASHAQGRPDKARVEEATAVFLLTANPMRWLFREIFRQAVPVDLEERYRAITSATRPTPAVQDARAHAVAVTSSAGPPTGQGVVERGKPGSVARTSTSRAVWISSVAFAVLTLAAALAYFFVLRNDGTDPERPALPELDKDFVDTRGGQDWGNKCWRSIQSAKWGYAKAECDEGMKMNPASHETRASLLYNEGLIAKASGRIDEARNSFVSSLALRESPTVRAALGALPP